MSTVNVNGAPVSFDDAESQMDWRLRKAAYDIARKAPFSARLQTFVDKYCEAHRAKYGEAFRVD